MLCIALPFLHYLLSSVPSPNSPLLIQDKPNIGSYTHVGNPVGTRHTPPPKGQHHWHAGKEWCKGPANAPVHTPADVTMAPPLSFDSPPLGPSRTEMAFYNTGRFNILYNCAGNNIHWKGGVQLYSTVVYSSPPAAGSSDIYIYIYNIYICIYIDIYIYTHILYK